MKDRLAAFRQLTDKHGHLAADASPSSTAKLSADTSRYFENALKVQDGVEELKDIVVELEKAQNNIITSTMHDDRHERELAECEEKAKKAFHAVGNQLKGLDECLKNSECRGETVETRMKRDQLSALRRVFEAIMSMYNASLLSHKDNCKKRIHRQLEITGTKKSESQVDEMIESGNLNVMMSQLVVSTKDAENALREVESRHEEIIRLEQSIQDLFDLFADMAAHVAMQSEILDRIECNVERTATTIQESLPQLKKARHYKKPKLFQWFS